MEKSTQRFTEPFKCGHCGNKAPMELVASYSNVTTHVEPRINMKWQEGPIWDLALCPACYKPTLKETYWHEAAEPDELEIEILYPHEDKLPLGLPPAVDKAYRSALNVKNIESNAFAVLLGRVLEIICIDQGETEGSLQSRLTSLAERGVIPEKLVNVASQLRQLRNIGAHAYLGDLTPGDVPAVDSLCRALLEYVYTAPELIKQVETKLRKRRKKSPRKRRSKAK